MTLRLHFHPLSSYCHKVLIALYENETPFEKEIVDLGNEASAAAFRKLSPAGKMPVLRDEARSETVPESSIIIEYLGRHYPGRIALIPGDADLALRTRLADRFYDCYVHDPVQRIVGDRLRPAGKGDPFGVETEKARLRRAYDLINQDMASRSWAVGEVFTLADCAAAAPLFYAGKLVPFADSHRNLAAYFERLTRRPSYARVLEEARPYLSMFPG
ncbi:MAG: glutathione S-transferase family protein [Reyranella sp.]|uniref:glutathione S-transferase family protein n=1 Tax=Reyranella sp. TaxID=1929291 RepID=UPI003D0D3A2F